MQMVRRNVNAELHANWQYPLQYVGITANKFKEMLRQRYDHPLGFGIVNKGIRWDLARYRMTPAQEYFQPGYLQALCIYRLLIDHIELVAFNRGKYFSTGTQTNRQNIKTEQTRCDTTHTAKE